MFREQAELAAAGLGKKLFACVHIPLGVGGRSHRLLVFTPHGLRATKTNFSSRSRIKFAAAGRRAHTKAGQAGRTDGERDCAASAGGLQAVVMSRSVVNHRNEL